MLLHRAEPDTAGSARFHDCSVDRRVVLSDAAARRKLIGVLDSDLSREGPVTGCLFTPHYGVHVGRGQQALDMEICFHCGQCVVFRNGAAGVMYAIRAEAKSVLAALVNE